MKASAPLLVLPCFALGARTFGARQDGSDLGAGFSGSSRSVKFSGLVKTENEGAEESGVLVGVQSRKRRLKSDKSDKSDKSNKSNKSQKSSKSAKSSKSSKKSKSSKRSKSHKSPKKRKCKNHERDDRVQLKCSAYEGKIKDKIDFTLTTGDEGAVVQVKYKLDDKSDAAGDGLRRKIEEEYEIYFSSLVEYLPAETLGFGWSEDETVQTIDLSDWKPFSDITKDDDGVLHFYVETGDGVARFNFKLSEEGREGRYLSANRIKIDVTLADFPWERDDTLVALLSRVEANTELETHYLTSKSRSSEKSGTKPKSKPRHPTDVEITYDNAALPFGKFVWVTSADVDDNPDSSKVVATSPPEHEVPPEHRADEIQYIAFSFLNSSRADLIYWDPEAGIDYPHEFLDAPLNYKPEITGTVGFSPQNGASKFGGVCLSAVTGLVLLVHALMW